MADTPDEESLAFEALVVREVAGVVVDALDNLVTIILTAYVSAVAQVGGALTQAQARTLGSALARQLRAFEPPSAMNARLAEQAAAARALGIERAARRIPPGPTRSRAASTKAPKPGRVPNVDSALQQGLAEAARIAESGIHTKGAAAAVAGKVKATRNRVQGSARWVAHEGLNAGTAAVAKRLDRRILWVPERNACLHCLAHAGWAVEPGDEFPAGLSFDPLGSHLPAVPFPPLHPGCRCEGQTFTGPAGRPDPDRSRVDPAARLAAEARRSVVYQWTDYASAPAAMRAAEALLHAGAGLPTSVEKRARRMLRSGGVRRP